MTDPDLDPTVPNPEQAAQRALAAVAQDWLRRPGVVAVEVARRWTDDAPTDQVGIRVTVERILPSDEVPVGELFPDEVDGIPVDVVEGSPPTPQ